MGRSRWFGLLSAVREDPESSNVAGCLVWRAEDRAVIGFVRTEGVVRMREFMKRSLPPVILDLLRLLQAGAQHRLYRPSHFAVWFRDGRERSASHLQPGMSRDVYIAALLRWIAAAQDAVPGGGVAGYYSFAEGWSAGYPETTGYIITTLLEASRTLKAQEWEARARRMIEWEIAVQLSDGSWQSGFVDHPKVPAVFNTGQIIDGLVAGSTWFDESRYLESACKGGRWLLDHQDEDGAWRQYVYQNNPNCYMARVAWPLLSLAQASGESVFRKSAVRYLEWASRCQDETHWFANCSLEPNEPALTHTLGYTIEGFLESGVLLQEERWISVAQRAADVLLHKFEVRKHLAGTYDKGWKPDHSFACLTGCAQMSRVWSRLYELTRDARYLNAALKINDYVLSHIDLRSSCPGIQGGVKGSQPVWGRYMSYRLPNWAAKFTLDALFQEGNALALFHRLQL